MTDPKVVVVDEQGAKAPTEERKRPDGHIAPLKPGQESYPGDVLVTLFPAKTKLKYGTRLSVRPQPEKCICKGRGWGVVEEDDGSRFKRRVPRLCKCIAAAVTRICGADAVLASWEPPVGDGVMAEWRAELAAQEAAAEATLVAIRAEREKQTAAAEAEAERVEAAATAAEPAAAEAARELGAARNAVAGAVTAEGQAKAILKDAEKTLVRARKELATAEAEHTFAAHAVDRTGAAQLRATAAILRGPKSTFADKERRAVAALERVRREIKAAAGRTVAAKTPDPPIAPAPVTGAKFFDPEA